MEARIWHHSATGALALTLLASAVAPAHARNAPVVESSRAGDAVEIHASADLAAERETAWRVLTDYGRYAEFIPDLVLSRIVARSDSTVIVEQRGSARFGPLKIPVEITFRIDERPPDALASRAIGGSLRSLESHYALVSAERGIRLVYTGRIDPGFPLFDGLERSIVEANVGRQFRALVREIERRAAAEATSVGR